MTRGQYDQYDMLLAVENHFNSEPEVWSGNPLISATKTALSNIISDITTEMGMQRGNITGITARKAFLRSDLEAKGFVVSAALSGYAAGDPLKIDLYNRVRFTKNEFKKFRGNEIMGVITNLVREVTLELPHLAALGITAETLATLTAANNTFGEILNTPTEAINHRKNATERASELIRDAIQLLKTQMDYLIVTLSFDHPKFVNVYRYDRAIHNTGSRQLSLTISTIDAVTGKPVAKADLEIAGKGITRVSGLRGYNTVRNLVEGIYELKASHPSYVAQTIPFTVVSGETTKVMVSLISVFDTPMIPQTYHSEEGRITSSISTN